MRIMNQMAQHLPSVCDAYYESNGATPTVRVRCVFTAALLPKNLQKPDLPLEWHGPGCCVLHHRHGETHTVAPPIRFVGSVLLRTTPPTWGSRSKEHAKKHTWTRRISRCCRWWLWRGLLNLRGQRNPWGRAAAQCCPSPSPGQGSRAGVSEQSTWR